MRHRTIRACLLTVVLAACGDADTATGPDHALLPSNDLVPVGDAALVVEAGRLIGIDGLSLSRGRFDVRFQQGTYDDVLDGAQPTFDEDEAGAIQAAGAIFDLINTDGTFADLPQDVGGCSSSEFCGIAIPFNGPYATGLPSTPFAVDVQTAFFEDGPADGVFSQPLATGELFNGEVTFAVFTRQRVSFSATILGASGPLADAFPAGEPVEVSYALDPSVLDTNGAADAGFYPDATLALTLDFPGLGLVADFAHGTVQTFDNTPNPDDQIFIFGLVNQNGSTLGGEDIDLIELDYIGTTSMLSSDALPTSVPPDITTISVYLGTASGHAWVQLEPVTPDDSYPCAAVTEIPQGQCEALLSFYESTNGAEWSYDGDWLQTTTPCSWYGVYCDGGSVTRLNITQNHLTGSLPSALAQLPDLQYLSLHSNQLAGGIPPELGELESLTTLDLYGNQLTGNIPAELGGLSSLRYMSLYLNALTGTIPAELGDLEELLDLRLYDNQLTGPIPSELGNLGNLQELQLQSNQLSGAIPSELGGLSSLYRLWLQENNLTGPIPPELGDLSNLHYLELYSNELTGTIPAELATLTELRYLTLHSNRLTGPIPPGLDNLTELRYLELHDNDLTGSIPPELGDLSWLAGLQLQGNELTGSIPPELGSLGRLRDLRLQGNLLTGDIPLELGDLESLLRLYVQDNQLGGLVPLGVAQKGGQIQIWNGTDVCTFVPPGNTDLYMPDTEAYRDADGDGDGYVCGLPFTADPDAVADDAVDLVEGLQSDGVTNRGQTNALTKKIDYALELRDQGEYSEAIAVLQDFLRQLNAFVRGNRLTEAEAAPLIERAEILIQLIEGATIA